MPVDFSKLQNVYQMMTPTDLAGTPLNTAGQLGSGESDASIQIYRSVLGTQGGAVPSCTTMISQLNDAITGVDDAQLKEVSRTIRIYSSEGHFNPGEWALKHPNVSDPANVDETLAPSTDGIQALLGITPEATNKKKFGVVLSDSAFVSPATIASRDAEMFLNYMPSHVMSRCVPYLSAEFVFDRPVMAENELVAPGLLKFLLGAAKKTKEGVDADDVMLAGNGFSSIGGPSIRNNPTDLTIAGMEMFTAPQTLQNLDTVPLGSRYVNPIDPMRPLATIEGLTIQVRPTFGLMSYKTAQLTIKLHDRSRLHELADLIKPQIYTKSTIWMTYGWSHPDEPENPYAEFINDNMLVREAYGISNSGYNFDVTGQAVITLQLYTKGARELRDIRINQTDQSFENVKKRIQNISNDIQRYRRQLKLDNPSGVLKEIRGFQILEAASQGSDPNIEPKELSKVLDKLEKSFLSKDTPIDKQAADELRQKLEELYEPSGAKNSKFAYRTWFENVSKSAAEKLFSSVKTGPDVFLLSDEKNKLRRVETGEDHPYVGLIESYEKQFFRDVRYRNPETKTKKIERKIVSFGKLFSVFLSNAVATLDGIDELQIMFYPFNKRAGRSAGVNIAEFPIDMSIFLDQYRDHILRRRADKITVEEFLKLVIDSQLKDVRGIGYGLFGHLNHYNPKSNKQDIKKGKSEEFESALAKQGNELGPFKFPSVTVYVESSYAGEGSRRIKNLIKLFDKQTLDMTTNNTDATATKIIRVHIYDKAVDPYPIATSLLGRDDNTGIPPHLFSVVKKAIDERDIRQQRQIIENATLGDGTSLSDKIAIDEYGNVNVKDEFANETIKKFVSHTVPTIVYGSNATMVTNASVSTKQDALLTSVQMMANKAGRPSVTQPNGGGTMGLPLRIIPAKVDVDTMGCPLLRYSQIFFFDFNTGTTIDNKYVVTGLTHQIVPGKFETKLDMSWYDAYGQYEAEPTLMNYLKHIEAPDTVET